MSSGLSLAFMVIGVLALVAAAVITVIAVRRPSVKAAREADQIRARAEHEAQGIVQRAKTEAEQAAQGRREVEEEIRAVKDEVRELRGDLERRELRLADREQRLDGELRRIEARSTALDDLKHELDVAETANRKELERISGMTAEQARSELVATIENQAKREAALTVRDIEQHARAEGDKRAREIVTLAIQRVAAEQTSESVVSVLHLPGEEMKGRIIGREGRNIRALENLTGVDVIIDDTPQAVVLSAFDGVRREIARLTIESQIADGRIHPSRIEEMYYQSKAQIEEQIVQAGEQACFEANVHGLHPELVK
ncbi:MAG TPA: Rnase Y domain-containing protein, partial [Streptosporangiaceae bacterium]|nr:Rnase Y domain-containing protein [Streptosporangiaceae bacterium]